jgi:hypothetical protein
MGKKGGRTTTEQQVKNEVSLETQDMPLDEVDIVIGPRSPGRSEFEKKRPPVAYCIDPAVADQRSTSRSQQGDLPARSAHSRGQMRSLHRRWRPSRTPSPMQGPSIGKKTSSGGHGPPMDEDGSSTTTYSSKSRSENQDMKPMNPSKISLSAPWNKDSFYTSYFIGRWIYRNNFLPIYRMVCTLPIQRVFCNSLWTSRVCS